MAVCVLIPAYEPEERFAEYAARGWSWTTAAGHNLPPYLKR